MYSMTLDEYCKEAVKRPSDFGYFGNDDDMFITVGRSGISTNRDADTLTRSNWQVITEDVLERFPNDSRIEPYGHWACGWVENLIIRIYDDKKKPTDVAKACYDYLSALEDYPVIDDMHYSALELEEAEEYLPQAINDAIWTIERDTDTDIQAVWDELDTGNEATDRVFSDITDSMGYCSDNWSHTVIVDIVKTTIEYMQEEQAKEAQKMRDTCNGAQITLDL